MAKLITAYRFDSDGYFSSTDSVMPNMKPDDDTLVAPDFVDGYWPRWDGSQWISEKMPESAEEFEELGIVIPHESHTKRSEVLRGLMRKFVQEGVEKPGEYAIRQDSATNDLSVHRVPELTAAELALKADEAEGCAMDADMADIKDRLIVALLMDDDEAVAELKAAYRELLGV